MYKVEKCGENRYLVLRKVDKDGAECEVARMLLEVSAMTLISEEYKRLCFEDDLESYAGDHKFSKEEIDRIYWLYKKALDNDDGWSYCLAYAVKEVLDERSERS